MSWAPRTTRHRFATGREAVLREGLPLSLIARRAEATGDLSVVEAIQRLVAGVEVEDPLAALRLQDAIVEAVWYEPRVSRDAPDPGDAPNPPLIPLDWLEDEELSETLNIAFGGVEDAARFPDEPASAGDGASGKSVAGKAKRASGTASRKR